jgi:hypothetical protein
LAEGVGAVDSASSRSFSQYRKVEELDAKTPYLQGGHTITQCATGNSNHPHSKGARTKTAREVCVRGRS